MRRRLDVGASLVGRPKVLFMDEPTTGLDPRSRLVLWELIEDLQKQGTTLLLCTQYLEEADHLCDRIAVIDLGTVIAEGTSTELKDKIGGEVLELHVAAEHLSGAAEHCGARIGRAVGRSNAAADPGPGRERGPDRAARDRATAGRRERPDRGHRPASADPR